MSLFRLLTLTITLLCGSMALAQDKEGSSDHPLIPRYDGSEIVAYATNAFTDFTLTAGPTKDTGGGAAAASPEEPILLEGRHTHILYRAPKDRSVLEVFRNYEAALKSAGFETLFTCARAECGFGFNARINPSARYNGLLYDNQQRYLAARLSRPEGDVNVALYVTSFEPQNQTFILLDVLETEEMDEKMVVIEASEMEQALARDGKIAIYGILFDFDSATITPDSQPQIEQLAALLSGNPQIEVLIVGHTDGKGAFDYNLSLSQRRAQAVVEALASGYGIAASRLMPAGAGMVAPVATNRTEEGRAKNRRVEIVERVTGQ